MALRLSLLRSGAALAGALTLSGCFSFVTKEEGQKMIDQITQLQKRSDDTELRNKELVEKLQDQSKKLGTLIADATRLQSNLADSAQATDKLRADVATLTGKAEDVQRDLSSLQKNFNDYRAASDTKIEQLVNASTTAKAPPMPETADGLFAEAQKRLDAKQWLEARRLFDAFVNRYNSDKRAASAQFHIADAYFLEGKYANAITAFLKVIEGFPKSEEVETAYYKNAQAFFALKYCSDSKIYLQELLKKFPKSQYKVAATELQKEIAKKAKDKTACLQ